MNKQSHGNLTEWRIKKNPIHLLIALLVRSANTLFAQQFTFNLLFSKGAVATAVKMSKRGANLRYLQNIPIRKCRPSGLLFLCCWLLLG